MTKKKVERKKPIKGTDAALTNVVCDCRGKRRQGPSRGKRRKSEGLEEVLKTAKGSTSCLYTLEERRARGGKD